jgi:hypothetical protein
MINLFSIGPLAWSNWAWAPGRGTCAGSSIYTESDAAGLALVVSSRNRCPQCDIPLKTTFIIKLVARVSPMSSDNVLPMSPGYTRMAAQQAADADMPWFSSEKWLSVMEGAGSCARVPRARRPRVAPAGPSCAGPSLRPRALRRGTRVACPDIYMWTGLQHSRRAVRRPALLLPIRAPGSILGTRDSASTASRRHPLPRAETWVLFASHRGPLAGSACRPRLLVAQRPRQAARIAWCLVAA